VRIRLNFWSNRDNVREKTGPVGEVEIAIVTEGQRSSRDSTCYETSSRKDRKDRSTP